MLEQRCRFIYLYVKRKSEGKYGNERQNISCRTTGALLAAVVPLLKKYRAEKAILFGSYARQDADAASDIDLIVVGGSNPPSSSKSLES